MKFRKGVISDFYGNSEQHERLIEERRKWLTADEVKYFDLDDLGVPYVQPVIDVAFKDALQPANKPLQPRELFRLLAETIEPDFLLLAPDPDGILKLFGGSVCFPSFWALEQKMRRPLDLIHGPVPGLNMALASQINRFLKNIRPGISWERTNWGLSRSAELNQHPSRNLPRLDQGTAISEMYLRIEWQSLIALPPHAVLFGIRLIIHPLSDLLEDDKFRTGLRNSLATMPEPVAQYKNVEHARQTLLAAI